MIEEIVKMFKMFHVLLSFLAINSLSFGSLMYCSESVPQNASTDTTIQQEGENGDDEDDGIVLLSYKSGAKQAGIVQTSAAKGCAKDDADSEDEDDIDSTKSDDAEKDKEIQKVSCDKIMEKDFADMRIVQLAGSIADDMGIVTTISLNR